MQVVKDPLKTKGARLSMELTIAGPLHGLRADRRGRRRLQRLDDKERERLRKEAKAWTCAAAARSAHRGARRQARRLRARAAVPVQAPRGPAEPRRGQRGAGLVFQEADLSVRVVRDIFSAHFERAIVDDPKQHQRLVSFFTRTAPELVDRVELYEERAAVRGYGVEKVIEGLISRRGPPERRLPDDRLRRGADGHRRQLRLVHRPWRQQRC